MLNKSSECHHHKVGLGRKKIRVQVIISLKSHYHYQNNQMNQI